MNNKMNYTFFLCLVVLLCCGKAIKSTNTDSSSPIVQAPNYPSSTGRTATSTDSTAAAPAIDHDELVSVQDVLIVDDTANEKIEKVVNTINEVSSFCKEYESINLSTEDYIFSENPFEISVPLSDKKAIFYSFSVSHWNNYNETSFLTACTILNCDSTNSTIEVTLPNNIQVSAKLKIINSAGKQVVKEGTTSMILKNPIISYQMTPTSFHTNFNDSDASQLSYDNSETTVKIDTKYQASVYSKLEVFITKMEASLRKFFVKQLATEINKRNISQTDTCSKMMKKDPLINIANTSKLNNFLNEVYVIPTVKQDTWNNVTLRAGPVLIHGIFSFKNVEFIVKKSSVFNNDPQYYNYYSGEPRNHTVKQLLIRIKTDTFSGQLEWQYNSNLKDGSKPLKIHFSVDFMDISCRIMRTKTYFVDASINKIKINTSPVISCENERRLVNTIMSEYLKSVITESIARSITEKLGNNVPSYVCVDRGIPGY